jgi:hypothetical protein
VKDLSHLAEFVKYFPPLNGGCISSNEQFFSNIPREIIFILVPILQHYLIKYVSDLRQVSCFSVGSPVSSINKTDRHDITEILLKVKTTYIYIYLYGKLSLYIGGNH